ncbi:MAG: transglycosylase SLT domain-containing protein [Bdellovibrionaceae bacterium]|nr:transglycosylase SLT domain-containing protein [Pseudobdellovibrionaceae bacterium]
MKINTKKKIRTTIVREHPRHVPVSEKNPTGITIVDRHPRRLPGTYLDSEQVKEIFKKYNRKGIVYPASRKLQDKYPKIDTDKYDELIAVWADYFNKKFEANPPLDPDVVKALIGSESGFRADPAENRKIALGIIQITKSTLKILLDPKGEVKDFTFKDIRLKDLKDPAISIPLGIRWLFRKRATAESKLKRVPTDTELILEYKGLLKSKTEWKRKALESYKKHYKALKSK